MIHTDGRWQQFNNFRTCDSTLFPSMKSMTGLLSSFQFARGRLETTFAKRQPTIVLKFIPKTTGKLWGIYFVFCSSREEGISKKALRRVREFNGCRNYGDGFNSTAMRDGVPNIGMLPWSTDVKSPTSAFSVVHSLHLRTNDSQRVDSYLLSKRCPPYCSGHLLEGKGLWACSYIPLAAEYFGMGWLVLPCGLL